MQSVHCSTLPKSWLHSTLSALHTKLPLFSLLLKSNARSLPLSLSLCCPDSSCVSHLTATPARSLSEAALSPRIWFSSNVLIHCIGDWTLRLFKSRNEEMWQYLLRNVSIRSCDSLTDFGILANQNIFWDIESREDVRLLGLCLKRKIKIESDVLLIFFHTLVSQNVDSFCVFTFLFCPTFYFRRLLFIRQEVKLSQEISIILCIHNLKKNFSTTSFFFSTAILG